MPIYQPMDAVITTPLALRAEYRKAQYTFRDIIRESYRTVARHEEKIALNAPVFSRSAPLNAKIPAVLSDDGEGLIDARPAQLRNADWAD